MKKAKNIDFQLWKFNGRSMQLKRPAFYYAIKISFYSYQISLGVSLRLLPCISSSSIRIHVDPIKVWVSLFFRKEPMKMALPKIEEKAKEAGLEVVEKR